MMNIKDLYENNVNIMQYCRDSLNIDENTTDSILLSYDLQAGSYIENLKNNCITNNVHIGGKRVELSTQEFSHRSCQYIADVLNQFEFDNILEAGVGEATSYAGIIPRLKHKNIKGCGFDISPSRIYRGKQFLQENNIPNTELIVADLLHTPFCDRQFDVVYTKHAIEPNTNNADIIIKELYRITKKYLILIEPSYELGNVATKENINKHKYIKNLKSIVDSLGYKIIKYELMPIGTYANQPAIMIIEAEEQGTENREQRTGNREQRTGNREQGTGNREQSLSYLQKYIKIA